LNHGTPNYKIGALTTQQKLKLTYIFSKGVSISVNLNYFLKYSPNELDLEIIICQNEDLINLTLHNFPNVSIQKKPYFTVTTVR
jgi:hypothetical protein